MARNLIRAIVLACLVGLPGQHATATAGSNLSSLDIPGYSCPMAHCDPWMSDLLNLPVPAGPVEIVWRRNLLSGEKAGSLSGLGGSGNGTLFAASFGGRSNNLVVYDYDGNRVWRSRQLLNGYAAASAPIVGADGKVLACDNRTLLLVDPLSDTVLWQSEIPGPEQSFPISPVMNADDLVILPTRFGPVHVYDALSGQHLGSWWLRIPGTMARYDTVNTAAVNGNRLFILAQRCCSQSAGDGKRGGLFAVDVVRTTDGCSFNVAWVFSDFGARSYSSPLFVPSAATGTDTLFFDGIDAPGGTDTMLFAVDAQTGDSLWRIPSSGRREASFARDPRGGFWTYSVEPTSLPNIEWYDENGNLLDLINMDELVSAPGDHRPISAMTIGGTSARPIMMTAAVADDGQGNGSAYLVAIDLAARDLFWKIQITDFPISQIGGQFPILVKDDQHRVVFSSSSEGVWAVGTAPQGQ